jgi:hypothetical protein
LGYHEGEMLLHKNHAKILERKCWQQLFAKDSPSLGMAEKNSHIIFEQK